MKEGNHKQANEVSKKRNKAIAEAPRFNIKRTHSDGDGANLLFMPSFEQVTGRITPKY